MLSIKSMKNTYVAQFFIIIIQSVTVFRHNVDLFRVIVFNWQVMRCAQEFNNSNLSVALEQRGEEVGGPAAGPAPPASWQLRLLLAGANAAYTRRHTLAAIATAIHKYLYTSFFNLP